VTTVKLQIEAGSVAVVVIDVGLVVVVFGCSSSVVVVM